ncbi:hypothetical protein F444_13672 [Phytophthora nicotianae P1976]|uniref:Uncharacterized protein n=1 Tax=Phytophthora nicotianae P1976 TaxID=1317066 RepID=A0A080ZT40_PHYNI|nr:hypothetical protein F444_13672 [Phytophthora nicotianae P1976]
MDQFEGWWHNLRQGQISMTPCHEQTESRDNDDSNDGGNACGGGNAEDTSSVAQAISGGGSSPSSDESGDLALTQQTAVSTQLVRKPDVPVKIKLNSRVVPVGRPRLNRKDSELKLRLI